MKTLLRIDCSSRTKGSHSRELADYFESRWMLRFQEGHIIRRDLVETAIPHIQNQTIEAFYTSEVETTKETNQALELSNTLIAELKQATHLLISSPLYNLNVPSNLKAYIDQIVRIGHTFRTTDEGYQGLLTDTCAYLITSKGGIYKDTSMEALDFQESYLPAILGFIGIQTKQTFSLEGSADPIHSEQNKIQIKQQINKAI